MNESAASKEPGPTDAASVEDASGADDADITIARCINAGVTQVELQFADVTGTLKSVFVPMRRLGEVLQGGEWFDGSSLEGSAREVESDMYLRPDPSTLNLASAGIVSRPNPSASTGPQDGGFGGLAMGEGGVALVPDDAPIARLLCDVATPDGQPYPGDSRSTLRAAVSQARDAGLDYHVAPEVEFFLFPPGEDGLRLLADDPSSYFGRSRGLSRQVEVMIVAALDRMDIRVESSHHEVATGQFELDLPLQPAMLAADAVVTLKLAVKEMAASFGLRASFMPKPVSDAAGSGMHTHQVAYGRDGENAFHDATRPYALSSLGAAFAAGQLDHAPGMAAIVAPLVNSYKRLVPGYEAPVAGSWGRHNRSALLRVPSPAPASRTSLDRAGTRLELRLPDPSCNPYLAFAVMLASGLDGIDRDLELSPPMEETEHGFHRGGKQVVRRLPTSLAEALEALNGDDVILEVLGSELVEIFRAAKRLEWETYRRQVTPWELDAYLDRY